MIEILKESFSNLFLSILTSLILTPIIIFLLYKFNQVRKEKRGKLQENNITNTIILGIIDTQRDDGTPNMGGIIILLLLPILSILLIELDTSIKILLLGFSITGIWGVIDVVIFTNLLKDSKKFIEIKKKLLWKLGKISVVTAINYLIITLLFRKGILESTAISNLLIINISPIVIFLLSILGQFGVYSAQLSDGLDGLMIGSFTIITVSFLILFLIQNVLLYIPLLMLLLGILVVILYFNIPPARFWIGGVGSMPLGFLFFFLALVTNNLLPYFLITSIIWIILISSILQALSFKIFKKRILKLAPIHHHFQATGWPSYKIVMRFWLFTTITSIIGIYLSLL